MPVQSTEIVEPHIGGDLKLQRNVIFSHLLQKLFPLGGVQVTGIEPVPDPDRRKCLIRAQRLLNTADTVCHIVRQTVIFSRMDAYHKPGVLSGNGHKLPQHTPQLQNVIDFFADNVTPGDIWVSCYCPKALQVVRNVITRCDFIPHNRQRNTADAGQKTNHNPRLPCDRWQYLVNLTQPGRGFTPVQQCRVCNLHIGDAVFLVFSADPQQQILKEGVAPVAVVLPVSQNHLCQMADLPVRYGLRVYPDKRILACYSLGKHIPIQINLFKICEYSLPVLRDGQAVADPVNVEGSPFRVAEDQIGEIDKREVVNSALPMLSRQREIRQLFFAFSPPCLQLLKLVPGALQPQFFNIIVGIADLMNDPQGNQHIRGQIAVHMGVKIRPEFTVAPDIGFYDGLFNPEPVVLGLAHQGFGDCRDGGFPLYGSVGINIGHFRVAESENIHHPVVSVQVRGHFSPYYQQAVFILRCPETA